MVWLHHKKAVHLHHKGGAHKGVHLSPLGFAACQSKKCTNQPKNITNRSVGAPPKVHQQSREHPNNNK